MYVTESTQKHVEWLMRGFRPISTYAGTINLEPDFRSQAGAEQVCRLFQRKLNGRIFGRVGAEKKQLTFLAVVHNREFVDNCHIHFAFGGFPEQLTHFQIIRKCYDAAANTFGVEVVRKQYLEDALIKAKFDVRNEEDNAAIWFEKIESAWLNYMIGHVIRGQEHTDTILTQFMNRR